MLKDMPKEGESRFWLIRTKKFWLIAIMVLVLLSASLATFSEPLTRFSKKILSRQSVYWAVNLNNGQVYYGQIKSINPETIVLADVFYMEVYENQPKQSAGESFQVQQAPQTIYNFIKRGGSDPLLTDNVLFINRFSVLKEKQGRD